MAKVVSATEARVHFGELMRKIREGAGSVVVEKDGEAQVVILSLEEYTRLHEEAQIRTHWAERVDRAREMIAEELGQRRLPDPADILREGREERDALLLGLR